jgi:hypothetical protein
VASRKFVLGLSLILGCSAVWAQKGPAVLEMDAEGEVQIAPDGSVSDYRLQSKLGSPISDAIDRNVRGWHFQPVVIEGRAVTARTAMHLALTAEPVEGKTDSYTLRVSSLRFGEMKVVHVKPPSYPPAAVRAHVGGKVMLAVRLDADGKVADVQAYQTSLDARARSEHEAELFRKVFEKAAVAAARDWQYDLSERIDGKAVGMNAMIPVTFNLCNMPCSKPDPEAWRALLPGPVHPAPWMGEQVADNDLSTLGDGQAMPLDSRFRLRDDVIGKKLL